MLRDQYGEHTSHGEKATIFFQYFVNLIGLEDNSDRQFNFQRIYDEPMRMEDLTETVRE
jgi:wobble nucleotide-excising tRNase